MGPLDPLMLLSNQVVIVGFQEPLIAKLYDILQEHFYIEPRPSHPEDPEPEAADDEAPALPQDPQDSDIDDVDLAKHLGVKTPGKSRGAGPTLAGAAGFRDGLWGISELEQWASC